MKLVPFTEVKVGEVFLNPDSTTYVRRDAVKGVDMTRIGLSGATAYLVIGDVESVIQRSERTKL